MFSKLFLKYCSLALLINLQTSFLARLKVAQSTGLSEILAFFSCLSLFFMATLISVVNQFGWFLFFQSFLFHRYLRIRNDSKNLYQLSTISSVSSKALSHGASLNSYINFWASRHFMSWQKKVLIRLFSLRSLTFAASNRYCWKVIRHSNILCLYTSHSFWVTCPGKI